MPTILPFLLSLLGACATPRAEEGTREASVSSLRYSPSGYDLAPPTPDRLQALVARLSPEQRAVTQQSGTERPGCGLFLDNHKDGTYTCVVCGLPLFKSDHKFNSGTGWPSFFQPFDDVHVERRQDRSHGMVRTEVRCVRCAAHLGHVFEDGPEPTGLRFCINSAALSFVEEGAPFPPESQPVASRQAFFAGGCFWGVEDAFAQVPGVLDAESGYTGGLVESPTYRQVCTGATGHAETVKVVFDPARVSYEDLVRVFFRIHDPTTRNRQGPDIGTQYRSAIFTVDEDQARTARAVMDELAAAGAFRGRPLVTEVAPFSTWWRAEDYHQDYDAKHGRTCPLPSWE